MGMGYGDSSLEIKLEYQVRRIPGVYLMGVKDIYRRHRLRRSLERLCTPAYPAGGGRPFYWCVQSEFAEEAQKILDELSAPDEPEPIFVDMETLGRVNDQDIWDSQFGEACLLPPKIGRVLVQAGLAVEETRGGYHRTDKTGELLDALYEQMGKDNECP